MEWDSDELNSRFLPYEVDTILRVPTAGQGQPDTRYWTLEKKGRYSIKTGYWSAYHTLHPVELNLTNGSSSKKDPFWNKIWNLEIPPKTKIFIWKAAHDIIASETNLVNHHVPGNPRCNLCGYHWANTSHTLLFCQETKTTWKTTEWWLTIKKLKGLNTIDILHTMDSILSRNEFEHFCVKLWCIWKDRCNWVHKPQFSPRSSNLISWVLGLTASSTTSKKHSLKHVSTAIPW